MILNKIKILNLNCEDFTINKTLVVSSLLIASLQGSKQSAITNTKYYVFEVDTVVLKSGETNDYNFWKWLLVREVYTSNVLEAFLYCKYYKIIEILW